MGNSKLNEGVQDILGNKLKKETDLSNVDFIKLNKNKKKKHIVIDEEIPEQIGIQETIKNNPIQNQIQQQEIIISPSLSEIAFQQSFQKQKQKQQIIETKQLAIQRIQQRITEQQSIPSVIKQKEAKKDLEIITDTEIPEDVNVVELEREINEAVDAVSDNISIGDIELTFIEKDKSKTGYTKVKTSIGSDKLPDIINKIATYIKQQTKGLIKPRISDMRVIGNTNKTQLRSSSFKLSSKTITFKPDHKKLKVSKYTRVMLSVPEDFSSTGNLLIYLQESRKKTIVKIEASNFVSELAFINFIGDKIAQFYFHGYDVTLPKLTFKGTNNPLTKVLTTILDTNQYKAKPYVDEDNRIYMFDVYSKGIDNQWLYIRVSETSIPDLYEVSAKNNVDTSWEYILLNKPISLNKLDNNILDILEKSYLKDWTDELKLQDEHDEFIYNFRKLNHNKLKQVAIEFNDLRETNPELNIELKKFISKKDMKYLLSEDYDSEAIIGQTSFVDYFVLTYLAYPIKAGDKRHGKQYITNEEYYKNYNVKDKRDYFERDKTAWKKQNIDRKYNARIYLFQLEYSANGIKHVYRNKTWESIKNNTGILTDTIKFPVTIF